MLLRRGLVVIASFWLCVRQEKSGIVATIDYMKYLQPRSGLKFRRFVSVVHEGRPSDFKSNAR